MNVGASSLQIAMQASQGWRSATIKKHTAYYVGKGDNTLFISWARHLKLFPEKESTAAMGYGREQEAPALAYYARATQQQVHPNGYFIKELEQDFTLGYSPDGLVVSSPQNGMTKGLVEIKSPYNATKKSSPLSDEVMYFYLFIYLFIFAFLLFTYLLFTYLFFVSFFLLYIYILGF